MGSILDVCTFRGEQEVRFVTGLLCLVFLFFLFQFHSARLTGLKFQKLAWVSEKQKTPARTIYFAREGLKINPYNIVLHGFLGVGLIDIKAPGPALRHLNLMLKYYPYHLNALYNAAIANYQLKNIKEYTSLAYRIERINPKYTKRVRVQRVIGKRP